MILLIIIYIAFISLGLPDSVLGSAWPSMYGLFEVPLSYAGVITMLISGGTIISSLFSYKAIEKFKTETVTLFSVALTALGLLGFSISNSFWQLCLWSIPYGLGAGSVDSVLNNFVALHFKAKHMSWLHCFWGIGAAAGPYIMGIYLTNGFSWNYGYRAIGVFQVALVICLFVSLPLWKAMNKDSGTCQRTEKTLSLSEVIRLPGAKQVLIAFFCYCAVETTAGLWASSYMVLVKNIHPQTAAKWASLFYLGITAGRFISGFVASKLGDRKLIRYGQLVCASSTIIILLPLGNSLTFIGLILFGLGCAPIFPSLLHATPENFGEEKSQAMMGMQMAFAYIGSTFMPLVFGFLGQNINMKIYPIFLMIFIVLMIIMVEKLNNIKDS